MGTPASGVQANILRLRMLSTTRRPRTKPGSDWPRAHRSARSLDPAIALPPIELPGRLVFAALYQLCRHRARRLGRNSSACRRDSYDCKGRSAGDLCPFRGRSTYSIYSGHLEPGFRLHKSLCGQVGVWRSGPLSRRLPRMSRTRGQESPGSEVIPYGSHGLRET
jgi:hypothetical protein